MLRLAGFALLVTAGKCDFCYGSYCVEVGFCRDATRPEVLKEQPSEQLERWQLPQLNLTHAFTSWRPAPAMCSRQRVSYIINLNSTSPLLNNLATYLGNFPQDACASSSNLLREGNVAESPCSKPFDSGDCTTVVTSKAITMHAYVWQAFYLVPNDLVLMIEAKSMLAPDRKHPRAQTVPLWCLSMRKYSPFMPARSPQQHDGGGQLKNAFDTPPFDPTRSLDQGQMAGVEPVRRRPVKRPRGDMMGGVPLGMHEGSAGADRGFAPFYPNPGGMGPRGNMMGGMPLGMHVGSAGAARGFAPFYPNPGGMGPRGNMMGGRAVGRPEHRGRISRRSPFAISKK